MFVTSTSEVFRPSVPDFIGVFLNKLLRFGKAFRFQAVIGVERHVGLDPELRLAFGVLHMDVSAGSSREQK